MRWLLLSVFCGVLFLFAPGYARAQDYCGQVEINRYECEGSCGFMDIPMFVGPGEGDNYYYAPVMVDCGHGQSCNLVQSWGQAGACEPDVVTTMPPSNGAGVNVENTVYVDSPVYVDAYVKVCEGRYVAMRMAI